jgi:hypothetical protein
MQFLLRGEDAEGNEVEFYRTYQKELMITIFNGHGSTHCIIDVEQVQALIDYLKLTDERI